MRDHNVILNKISAILHVWMPSLLDIIGNDQFLFLLFRLMMWRWLKYTWLLSLLLIEHDYNRLGHFLYVRQFDIQNPICR